MDSLRSPAPFRLTGNVAENWKFFRQAFELFWEATSSSVRPDSQKLACFLHVAGPEAVKVYNSFTFTSEERTYSSVVQKFETYCTPRINETYERYVFRNLVQKEGESVEQFLVILKEKANSCNFGLLTDSIIRDQIVFGILDKKLRERLLREESLTLESALRICQVSEITDKQIQAWDSPKVDEIKGFGFKAKGQRKFESLENKFRNVKGTGSSKDLIVGEKMVCRFCRRTHQKGKCPAYGKVCFKCKKNNHFASACLSQKKAHAVEDTSSSRDACMDDFCIDDVQVGSVNELSSLRDWIVPIKINGVVVNFKVDTGAQVDLLPWEKYDLMKSQTHLQDNTVQVSAYGGQLVRTMGKIEVELSLGNKSCVTQLIVVEKGLKPLLGLNTCEKLGLIRRVHEVSNVHKQRVLREQILKDYPRLFSGIGCLKSSYSIKLKENATPVIQPPRRVPYALRKRLKIEIDRMSKAGIIKRVEGPTDWVSSLVIVDKPDGSLRLCLDPKHLNENIKREHFQLPTREELLSELAGAKYFSKIDAKSGFYQIPLDKSSEEYCTFNTPFGRYCFRKLPFGLNCAPEVFHQRMVEILEGLEGLLIYLDDILIWGRTLSEHNERLLAVLKRLQAAGLTLNKGKCTFAATEIRFLGDIISEEGVKPDPEKVTAVLNLPTPTTKKELMRVLGIVNYFSKYIPLLSAKTESLRQLLKNTTPMHWNGEHEKEFKEIKEVLVAPPVLRIFDPKLPSKVSVDASGVGLGAVLQQLENDVWRPVAYASRSLTDVEMRYAPIEKEALALVFGVTRFHSFLYGFRFLAETDHKPLTSIVKKNLVQISPRLQRLFMKLVRYNFELSYVPGKLMFVPDTLSRAPFGKARAEDLEVEQDIQVHVNFVLTTSPVGDRVLSQIRFESERDVEISGVMRDLGLGNILPLPYNSFKDELAVVDGLLMRNTRIVIPKVMRAEMLSRLHEGHLGLEKCLARARQSVYWPGLYNDLQRMRESCGTCNKFRYKQVNEPFILRETTHGPWQRVGVDIFCYGRDFYLVLYDSFSNYPEVEKLNDQTAESVIACMAAMFGRHGIPLEVDSDNGPQFTSRVFAAFARKYNFVHVTSSPRYPQSNGLAEKGVQIVKRLLKKSLDCGGDFQVALLNYRTTPLPGGSSPAELLMGRRLRSRLPSMMQHTSCKVQKQKQITTGTLLPELSRNDVVRIREDRAWDTKAKVLEQVAPRSYRVCKEDGRVVRRNRVQLLKTQEQFECHKDGSTEKDTSSCAVSPNSLKETCDKMGSEPKERNCVQSEREEVKPVLRRSTRVCKPPDRLVYK